MPTVFAILGYMRSSRTNLEQGYIPHEEHLCHTFVMWPYLEGRDYLPPISARDDHGGIAGSTDRLAPWRRHTV